MAIQIWDAQAGQYKSADLARFGGSGTLKEALVWDGTQYVKVWPPAPTGPTPLWTDDFTSPTPHPRWILFGPYNPPGLDTGAGGPQVSDDFELSIEADPAGMPLLGASTSDFSAGMSITWVEGRPVLVSEGAPEAIYVPSPHPPNATIGVRRQAGVWYLLVDGVSVGSAPDPFAGNALYMIVGGSPGYPVTFVSYTEL